MTALIDSLRWVHVVAGFAGLTAFWVPIFARKGGNTHVLFGRIYLYSAYVVVASAGTSVLAHLAKFPLEGIAPSERPSQFAFLIFLAYLAFVTLVVVRHGVGVIHTRRDPAALATPLNLTLARLAIVASVGLIMFALWFQPPNLVVLLALSPIGLGTGRQILSYLGGKELSAREWMYEHLGAMLGGGIAFHTAFAVFGSVRMFNWSFDGWVGVVPWILPAAVGIPATIIWTRYYRRKFGELQPAN